jgi:hypothetical protein
MDGVSRREMLALETCGERAGIGLLEACEEDGGAFK